VAQHGSMATLEFLQANEKAVPVAGCDATAFASIVREHQSMVFSVAYHFLRERALSEEIAQEAFLRLYQNLDSIESRSHMVNWLRKVTWRLCVDEVRKRPSLKDVSLDDVAEPAVHLPDSDPFLAEHLRGMIAGLPEGMRMTVILRYQEDMELSEIAEVLDVPINTVKSRLQRGLAMLRERISRQSGGQWV
jgi:RNA polymerase sigma-70 factor (ECF subfamily)